MVIRHEFHLPTAAACEFGIVFDGPWCRIIEFGVCDCELGFVCVLASHNDGLPIGRVSMVGAVDELGG